jgi:hypothetical protein
MGHTKHVYPWSLEIEWSLRQIDIILKASSFLSSSCSGTFLLAPIVRGLGAGRANEGTLPRIRQRWTAAETNSASSVQGSVQVFELATWHGRGA